MCTVTKYKTQQSTTKKVYDWIEGPFCFTLVSRVLEWWLFSLFDQLIYDDDCTMDAFAMQWQKHT